MNNKIQNLFNVLNRSLTAVLFGLLMTPAAGAAEAVPEAAKSVVKEKLVLMPLRVSEEDAGLQGAMETALVQGLKDQYEVFSGEQVAQKAREIFMKESSGKKEKKDCDETRCMQDIAEAFQAELISTANVTKRSDGYFLAISIQNIFDNKVVFSSSVPCRNCDAYQVIDQLKILASNGAKPVLASGPAIFRDCPGCPEMLMIPQGGFEMGGEGNSEKPVHTVAFVRKFAISKTEVTQAQWKAIMGNNPSEFKQCGDNCPVENVSWEDAQKYVSKLSKKTGKAYRLPTEAEWEYACRGGWSQKFCGSDLVAEVAWIGTQEGKTEEAEKVNASQATRKVASKSPNAFGLYDMSGNVWEWVQDAAHENYEKAPNDGSEWKGSDSLRVLRGGSWYHPDEFAKASARGRSEPDSRNGSFGFRVAITK